MVFKYIKLNNNTFRYNLTNNMTRKQTVLSNVASSNFFAKTRFALKKFKSSFIKNL